MSKADRAYQIDVDLPRHLVRATLHGYWDAGTATDFSRDLDEALVQAASPSASVATRLLIDARDQGVQSQEVVASFGSRMIDFKGSRPRIALLVSSTLHKMQATRIASLDQQELFSSEQKAIAWLLDEEEL